MDVGKSIGYVFEDKKWSNKLLIGFISQHRAYHQLCLAGLGDRHHAQRLAARSGTATWLGRFWRKVRQGRHPIVVGLIYSLPALIITCPLLFVPFTRGDFGRDGQQALGGPNRPGPRCCSRAPSPSTPCCLVS